MGSDRLSFLWVYPYRSYSEEVETAYNAWVAATRGFFTEDRERLESELTEALEVLWAFASSRIEPSAVRDSLAKAFPAITKLPSFQRFESSRIEDSERQLDPDAESDPYEAMAPDESEEERPEVLATTKIVQLIVLVIGLYLVIQYVRAGGALPGMSPSKTEAKPPPVSAPANPATSVPARQ